MTCECVCVCWWADPSLPLSVAIRALSLRVRIHRVQVSALVRQAYALQDFPYDFQMLRVQVRPWEMGSGLGIQVRPSEMGSELGMEIWG